MAIQVAGTPIITDAKALNGITSIDTTTKNAFSAGGVGGATSLITAETTATSGTAITINMNSGYDVYYLDLFGWQHNYTAFNNLLGRLTDSSGTAISGSETHWSNHIKNTQQQRFNNNAFYFNTTWYEIADSGRLWGRLKFSFMEDSNRRTQIEYWTIGTYAFGSGDYPTSETIGIAAPKDIQVNRGISFFTSYSNTISNAKYQLWGVKL